MKQLFIKSLITGDKVAFKYNKDLGVYCGKTFDGVQYYTEGESPKVPITTEMPSIIKSLDTALVLPKVFTSKAYVPGFKNQQMALGIVVKKALTYDIGFHELKRKIYEAVDKLEQCSDEEELVKAKKQLKKAKALAKRVLAKTVKKVMKELKLTNSLEGEIQDVIEEFDTKVQAFAQYPSVETNVTLISKIAYAVENELIDDALLTKLGNINNIAGRKAGEKIIDIKDASEVAHVKLLEYEMECEYNRQLSLNRDNDTGEIKVAKKLFYFEKEENKGKDAPVLIDDLLAVIKETVFNLFAEELNKFNPQVENVLLNKTVDDYLESQRSIGLDTPEEIAEREFVNEMLYYLIDLRALYGVAAKYTFSDKNDRVKADDYEDEEEYKGAIYEMWDTLKDFIQNSAVSYARDILGATINNKTRSLIFIAAILASKLYRDSEGELQKSSTTSNFVSKCFRSYYISYLNGGRDTMEFSIPLPRWVDADLYEGNEAVIVNGLVYIPGNAFVTDDLRFLIKDKITVAGKVKDGSIVYDYKIFMEDEDANKYYHVVRYQNNEDLENNNIRLGEKASFLIDANLIEDKEDLENAIVMEGTISDYITFNEYANNDEDLEEEEEVSEVILFVTLDNAKPRNITDEEYKEYSKLFNK